tara:strand:+ start:244 stop:456 length:213 start_codon:yes stop_codon:yes gene_type:complete
MAGKSGLRHGFTGALYQRIADNTIKVTTKDGVTGIFDGEGQWIEGELFEADPELCIWLSAKRIDASHRLS